MIFLSQDTIKMSDLQTKVKVGVRIISPEKRNVAREKTNALLRNNIKIRAMKKNELDDERHETEITLQAGRDEMLKRWIKKTAKSPFAVGLHAEDERIVEENRIRTREEKERSTILKLQKERAKKEIIAAALEDHAYMHDLRKERKHIMDEEQKLKGLMDLTKSDKVKYTKKWGEKFTNF